MKNGKPDYILIGTVITLILLGVIILTSVSAAISQEKFGSPTFYLFHHLIFGLIPGALLGLAAFKISLSRLKKWSFILLLANLLLLALVFVPKIGISLGGAKSWLNFGIVSFQPSEFLKLTFILYLSFWLAARKNLMAFLAAMGLISLLLVLQPDIGTLGIIVMIGIVMYFLAGAPWKQVLIIVSAVIGFLIFFIRIEPYRFQRVLVFLNQDPDAMGKAYQIQQALIAIGSGGIFGKGAGMSMQKFGFLPQPMADSIFAVFSEEWGLVGALVLISLFLIFIWRGFSIAKNTTDKFYKLAAAGLTSWLALQTFVNIGSMIGILPLTGVPLPFISYGGSALLAELIGVGILLNISKHA